MGFTGSRTLRGAASAFAMALTLAGGALGGAALIATPAAAQEYTKKFVEVYQPVATIVSTEGGDLDAARGQLEGVYAAIGSEDDRNAAGSLTLNIGTKLSDKSLQRRGLEMMLQSGKVAPEQQAQFQFFVGNLAYDANDYAAARTALQAAYDAGYREQDVRPIIAESYFGEGQNPQGIAYIEKLVAEQQAAGEPVNENLIRRALRFAYEGKDAAKSTELSALLISTNPSAESWKQGLQVVNAMVDLEPQAQLDLLRLMLVTDSLSERSEFVTYIEAADVRVMSNEVQRVLAKGLEKGIFTASDDYYSELKRLADQRAPIDAREAPGLVTEARSAAQGNAAQGAGDVQLSLADYAQAEAMYQLALEKGVTDRDRNLTRLGIAQAMQGKGAEAKATLEQVAGARAPVARMWMAYVDTKA
ncbi:hypothetical protein PK98_05585 [Croceibacterium mercuriale]|uniref:Chemotaxis protein n=2 Tax=Croceibacterium mercuriale TaxID=1572751 RepID=A0A0B2C1G4_9SPHN|nr:hypothetical protein PK98_05585 [Croceibacterium mercuriale]